MNQLSPTARAVYRVLMALAVVVDVAVAVWLFADVGSGLGVGFLVAGAWIPPVAVHVLVPAIARSSRVSAPGRHRIPG